MKKRIAVILAVAASLAAAGPARAAGSQSVALAQQEAEDNRLLIAGLGAIAGVVAFNLATGGTGALPFLYEAGGAAGASAASGAVAASRVYAISTAVGGALIADSLYRRQVPTDQRTISRALSDRVAPR